MLNLLSTFNCPTSKIRPLSWTLFWKRVGLFGQTLACSRHCLGSDFQWECLVKTLLNVSRTRITSTFSEVFDRTLSSQFPKLQRNIVSNSSVIWRFWWLWTLGLSWNSYQFRTRNWDVTRALLKSRVKLKSSFLWTSFCFRNVGPTLWKVTTFKLILKFA
jgi:hypothetical protein